MNVQIFLENCALKVLSIYQKYPLRSALKISWRDIITNQELYGELPLSSQKIRERKLRYAGLHLRSRGEIVYSLILWIPNIYTRTWMACKVYVYVLVTLFNHTGITTEELKTTMKDIGVWRAIMGVLTEVTECVHNTMPHFNFRG